MKDTRKHFTYDFLVQTVYTAIEYELSKLHTVRTGDSKFCNIQKMKADLNAAMAALAMFSLKFPSMLQFDVRSRQNEYYLKKNLKLFKVKKVPCDTYMRERLDEQKPKTFRGPFTAIFGLLQNAKVLQHFLFLEKFYLISIDATGIFSSSAIHCENCCEKKHKDGKVTYYHQMLGAALVHPDQRVVFPLAPEMIMNEKGSTKNDCERNAFKRWLPEFRREHPHLPVVIVADGLHSNKPLIELLGEHDCRFIIVCKDEDHKYLIDWFNSADNKDATEFEVRRKVKKDSVVERYRYMKEVPLSDSGRDCKVNVVRQITESSKGVQKWMWVTDLDVTRETVPLIAKGGRSRWKIENETFNTLKNQGYEFEHNYGHGHKNLNTVLTFLMLIAFLIDQCLQRLNKGFEAAYATYQAKYVMWEQLRSIMVLFIVPSLEGLYELMVKPPGRAA
jgi:hypothetical protein